MSESPIALTRPPLPYALLEAGRALSELSMLPAAEIPLSMAPSGDGHSVVVCPGFLTSDRSTGFLRRFIRSRGYNVYGWSLGRNLGPGLEGRNIDELADWVITVYRQSRRKVSLVGWSLGGVMARELAKRMPDAIRQVVTLGSPISGQPESSTISWLYERVAGPVKGATPEMQLLLERLHHPPVGVPSTAIFTKSDGIVPWRGCIEPEGPLTDNIEVMASHCGLGVNPFVFFAVADRLALPERQWTPFDRTASPWRRVAYPTAGHVYD
ncbi:MAG: alpha/beta fold hydrolase [Alphaproteobacteria bacterium]|nr:alpha/beta fold hydrolase [Alphaproteobacteria bacterium]